MLFTLRYSSSSNYFQGSTNNTSAVYLFKKAVPLADPEGITVNPATLSMTEGASETITATVTPSDANKTVTWSSDDPSVATVVNGVVTAVGAGSAIITATTVNDLTATCAVTVTAAPTTTYVLTDKLEEGKKYLIASGNDGSVFVVSNTLSAANAAKAAFTCEIKNSDSGAVSAWLNLGGKYLYTASSGGLRISDEQTGSGNTGKYWHYKADGKNLLWFFKDTGTSDGYTDTSNTYKYYLQCNAGNFTAGHASSTSLADTDTPMIYLFVEEEEHSHTLVKTGAKEPTCTEAGNIEYWTCSKCGKIFSDAEGTTEITAEQTVVAATGHDWGEVAYTWAEDNSSVTAKRTCANDSTHVETETANATLVTVNATCTEAGSKTWTSAAFANEAFTVQTKTEAIEALGHAYGTRLTNGRLTTAA